MSLGYRRQLQAWAKRRAFIKRLERQGFNYAQIGRMLNPKLSRQRVRQIVNGK